ncbi:MAG: hypothetical protein ACLS9K_14150 [Lachnospira eligens]
MWKERMVDSNFKAETAKTDTEVSPKPDIRNGFMTRQLITESKC